MDRFLAVATSNGIVLCERQSHTWDILQQGLTGLHVTSVIAREGVILAGTTDGIFRSDDLGWSWIEASQGLAHGHVRWMAFDPEVSDCEFAGTEPAEIYRSTDGGEHWQSCPEVAALRDRHRWYLPYSPEAGCVRGFAFHGRRAYAAVEVGGVLISEDGGAIWKLAPGSLGDPHRSPPPTVHPDVHSILVHPASPDWVYAPTGGGLYRSLDGGRTWELLYDCYCRAVWVDPGDADHILLGPADGVDRNGRIEESRDGGRTWKLAAMQPASAGLGPPWPRHMVERFYAVGDELLAVLSNGELLRALVSTFNFEPILADIRNINSVTCMNKD